MNLGSGFSFSDVLADFAGVAFAQRLKEGDLSLQMLSSKFRCGDHLPDPVGLKLEDGLSPQAFAGKYGSLNDKRLLRVIRTLRENVRSQYKTHPPEKD